MQSEKPHITFGKMQVARPEEIRNFGLWLLNNLTIANLLQKNLAVLKNQQQQLANLHLQKKLLLKNLSNFIDLHKKSYEKPFPLGKGFFYCFSAETTYPITFFSPSLRSFARSKNSTSNPVFFSMFLM